MTGVQTCALPISGTAYILNYERKWKNGLGIGISLEQPTFDEYAGRYEGSDHPELKGTQFYDDASQPIPDIPAYIEYTGKNDNRIKLAGIIRNFFYIDNKAPNTRSICGWGVQLCGNFNPAKPLTVYYQALYGKGVANYINDLNGRKVSYIPQNDKPGKMTPAPMLGWFAAVNYELPNKLKLGYIYSEARIWKTSTYNPDYKYGQYMAANAFYPVREYLVLGAEWLWGKHQTFIHESGTINRVQAMIKIAF